MMPLALDAARCALPVGTRLGEFEVRRVIGGGGFGVVYEAFDHVLERVVAVKEYLPVSLAARAEGLDVVLRDAGHEKAFARGLRAFVQEARLLARFDDAALVKVHRYWQQYGTAYMVMPLLKGQSLRQLRQGAYRPSTAGLRALLMPLLGALEKLHAENVLHRDVSPDNILLLPSGQPVLLDVGSARQVLSQSSAALTAVVKAAYAPIEQYGEADGVRQGPWTDLYALGATLHFMVCGEPPAPSPARVVNDAAPPLASRSLLGVEPGLLRVIDKMLAPRPQDRPQSVAALRGLLARECPAVEAGAASSDARSGGTLLGSEGPSPVIGAAGEDLSSEVERTVVLAPEELPGAALAAMPRASTPPAPLATAAQPEIQAGPDQGPDAVEVVPQRGAGTEAASRVAAPARTVSMLAAGVLVAALVAWWALGGRTDSAGATAVAASVPVGSSPSSAVALSTAAPLLDPARPAGNSVALTVSEATKTSDAGASASGSPTNSMPSGPTVALVSAVSPSAGSGKAAQPSVAGAPARTPRRAASAPAAVPTVLPTASAKSEAAPPAEVLQVAAVAPAAPSVAVSPAPVAPRVPTSPAEVCSDRSGLARGLCVSRVCRTAEWRTHQTCVNEREEREKREAQIN